MKFTIAKDELNSSIQHVSKAISSRTTIPILTGIKMDASSRGLTLTASDTDISIQSFIPAEQDERVNIHMEKTGSVVLPAKFFVEIAKKLPSDKIEIEVKESFQTWIRSGSAEIQLVGLDPEDYPTLPTLEENHVLTVPSDVLKSMIRQTVFAVSANESTPVLTGVLWNLSNQKLKFVATDRHRLASREVRLQVDESYAFQNIVIPGKTLNELNKILPDENMMIDIVVADNQVLFRVANVLFFSRILDGTYPDTSKIIPQTYKTELVVPTRQLAEAIDRAYLLSREEKTNIVRLTTLDEHTIEISSSSSELGRVTEQLVVQKMNGEPLKIAFNSKYMLDVLKIMDCESIHIGFTGAMSPIIVKPYEDAEILHLILPYRTTS